MNETSTDNPSQGQDDKHLQVAREALSKVIPIFNDLPKEYNDGDGVKAVLRAFAVIGEILENRDDYICLDERHIIASAIIARHEGIDNCHPYTNASHIFTEFTAACILLEAQCNLDAAKDFEQFGVQHAQTLLQCLEKQSISNPPQPHAQTGSDNSARQ